MPTKKKQDDRGTALSTDRKSMMPEGTFRMQVVDSKEEMGGSGYVYWGFTLMVAGGDWDGETLWNNVSHAPKARFKVDEWLDAFALSPGKEVYHGDFVGEYCRVKVVHGSYQGKTRPEIDSVLPDAGASKGQPELPGIEAEKVTDEKGLPDDATPERKKKKKAF